MIKIKKITPMFNAIVTTADKYTEVVKVGNIIDPTKNKTGLKEYQTVIAVGTAVRDIKVGDLVCINPKNYARQVQSKDSNSLREDVEGYTAKVQYHFNMIELDSKDCLLLFDRDIDFIINEYEEAEESNIEKVTPTIEKSPLILQ